MDQGGTKRQDERDTRDLAMLRATGRDGYRSAAAPEREARKQERKPRR